MKEQGSLFAVLQSPGTPLRSSVKVGNRRASSRVGGFATQFGRKRFRQDGNRLPRRRKKNWNRLRRNPKSRLALWMFRMKHHIFGELRGVKSKLLAKFPQGLLQQPSAPVPRTSGKAEDMLKMIEQLKEQVSALRTRVETLEQKPPAAVGVPQRNGTEVTNGKASNPSIAKTSNPAVAKYQRMLGVGISKDAVMQAMKRDQVDVSLLFPEEKGATRVVRRAAPISANLLQGVKLQKRSRASPSKGVLASNSGNSRGAILNINDILTVKLRKSTPMQHVGKENSRQGSNVGLSMKDIMSVQLRKTTLSRSPGGTPAKKKRVRTRTSPSKARTDGEFLELALKRKFAGVGEALSPTPLSPSF